MRVFNVGENQVGALSLAGDPVSKGAVSPNGGELGIIPDSMGARSFIVRGKGDADSFCNCSHGADRAMGPTEAKRRFTVEAPVRATEGVECRKDAEVIDETPMTYRTSTRSSRPGPT